jgi:hypothetical protein
MKVNKVSNNIKIDLNSFYNEQTGETLASEIVGNKITVTIKKENTELFTLKKPENFSFINLDTLIKLYDVLSNVELGYLFKLIPLTKTEMNVIFNNTIPHSNYTLQNYLQIKSNSTFHTLIKKLITVGVLYQFKGNIQGAVRLTYILNPNVSNRRKTFDKSLIGFFKNFNY